MVAIQDEENKKNKIGRKQKRFSQKLPSTLPGTESDSLHSSGGKI